MVCNKMKRSVRIGANYDDDDDPHHSAEVVADGTLDRMYWEQLLV